jgi:surfeit locus 1 family protein
MSPGARKTAAVIGAAFFFCSFLALGTWQLQRRVWKLDLIGRVEGRVHAPAAAAPAAALWSRVSAAHDEYRHVRATGVFLHRSETLVQAATELGSGFWVLTPLRLNDGGVILVNRGFISQDRRDPAAHAAGETTGPTTVTGLLRMTEPGGAFLRHNDAPANRWYSRDVQAIAAARSVGPVAPYFIDADASRDSSATSTEDTVAPVGGLTVIVFHNNHLVYAVTWYTLALMTLGAVWRGVRDERAPPPTAAGAQGRLDAGD